MQTESKSTRDEALKYFKLNFKENNNSNGKSSVADQNEEDVEDWARRLFYCGARYGNGYHCIYACPVINNSVIFKYPLRVCGDKLGGCY